LHEPLPQLPGLIEVARVDAAFEPLHTARPHIGIIGRRGGSPVARNVVGLQPIMVLVEDAVPLRGVPLIEWLVDFELMEIDGESIPRG